MARTRIPRWYVPAPCLPIAPQSDASSIGAWFDFHSGEIREGLLRHLGENPTLPVRAWISQTETCLRRYALDHSAALSILDEQDRMNHLISLQPLLQLLSEREGEKARALFLLRLGSHLTARLSWQAHTMGILDSTNAALEALVSLAEKIGRYPDAFDILANPDCRDPQVRLMSLIHLAGRNELLDQRRRGTWLAFSDDPPEQARDEEPIDHDLRVALDLLRSWEDGLEDDEHEAYVSWLQRDGETNFWPTFIAEHQHACSRARFFRRLGTLGERFQREFEGMDAPRAPRALSLLDLRIMGGAGLPEARPATTPAPSQDVN